MYGQQIFKKVAKNTQWGKIVSSINDTRKTGNSHGKEWNWNLTYITHKTNSKWIKDLNVRLETVTFFLKKIKEKLFDIGLNNNFLYMTSKAQRTATRKSTSRPASNRKFLQSKRNSQQNETTAYWMGENISKHIIDPKYIQ